MAHVIMPLLETDEVENILKCRYEGDENCDAIMKLLMARAEDGSMLDFLYETFDTWSFENYWSEVEQAVFDWADDLLEQANNTDRE